ncbi:hypothetical protein D6D13_06667 [Aureobasidium pullulans]|uniref:Mid2 domain-containing protein n=1 Tax=Aureobasidium pullulans TaxID=5580 RepID=A0A4V4IZU0_AURPU|nr:hypothetical protein D6D13_06667 [Aureobasidium pullulans]
MFTPAITGYGPQMTVSPYTLPSLSTVAQTTLIQELRRGNPPAILTNAQTCGYTSGAWSSAVTCGPQQSCTYYTTPYSAPNFGCCSEGVGCGYVSTCLDYKAMGNSNRGAGVLISDQQFLCGSEVPYCSTVLLYGTTYAPSSSYSFYSYGCLATSNAVVVAFQTTLDGRAATTTSSSTSASAAATTSSVAEASYTPTTTPSSSSTTSTSTSSSITTKSSQTTSSNLPVLSKVNTEASPTSVGTISSPAASIDPALPSSTMSPTGLSQTSQIGIAVGVSIGVGLLLAALGFAFWRHRKAKHDKRWHDQPSQSFPGQYYETGGNKSLHPFDHRFSSLRSTSSVGKSEILREAPYELSSTGRRHELAANNQ